MEISEKQKDKILEYLCKKFGIKKFFMFHAVFYSVLYAKMLDSPSSTSKNLVFAETTPIFIKDPAEQIIDILLQKAKENDIFVGDDLKILEKGTTIEQLAIEADLNS